MKITRLMQTIRASSNISYAIQEGRSPNRSDLAVLGLEDIFDTAKLRRKPLN